MSYYPLIILAIFITGAFSVCPPSKDLAPCTCNADVITCEGNNDLQLSTIFESLSLSNNQKHYYIFYLNNNYIQTLNENTFDRITFDRIVIDSCSNLTSIDRNAFTETNLVTDYLQITYNPKLNSPDNSIFEVLSKFKNASTIYLWNNNIRVIPSKAFKPINGFQDRLQTLHIYGKSFEEIGENAFYYLKSLVSLVIYNTTINYIPTNAFAFRDNSNTFLELHIYLNKFMENYNICKNAFLHLKRPTKLRIDSSNDYKISYLEEKIFLPFLLKNSQNIIITAQLFDCDDCRNVWLQNSSIIQNRIQQLKCSNNNTINDPANFKKCNCFGKKILNK